MIKETNKKAPCPFQGFKLSLINFVHSIETIFEVSCNGGKSKLRCEATGNRNCWRWLWYERKHMMSLIHMNIITEPKCSTDLRCISPNCSVNIEVSFFLVYCWENETKKPYVLQKVQTEMSKKSSLWRLSLTHWGFIMPTSVLKIGIFIPLWKGEEF